MSASPENTYITEVAYPAHFHREMMPQWLHACLTGLGQAAPAIDKAFTWLELGCGSGVNLLAAAANYPQAQFVGVDFSAREIAQAQQWAEASGLANVHFLHADISAASTQEQLQSWLASHAPKAKGFDYIASHGVYSWVGPVVRAAMHALMAQLLAPQGIAYLAYNSQPGAASLSATQRLMWLNAQRLGGSPADAVRNSLDLVMALAKGGAGNYIEQPALLRELERINGMEADYLAHEFLNEHWCAHHVSDVMQALAKGDCHYIGSATAIENINALSLPAKLQGVIAHMQSQGMGKAQIETAKDIARNQNMRRDVFQKSPTPLSESAHRERLLTQHVQALPAAYAAQPQPGATAIALPTRIGAVELPLAQVQPILQALQHNSQSYAALAALAAYRNNPGLLNPMLQTLAWAGWIEFVQPATSHSDQMDVQARVQRLRATLSNAGLHDLASRVDCLTVAAP